MDRNRKTALIILSVFSVAVVIISFFNFRQSLNSPFAYKNTGEEIVAQNNDAKTCSGPNCSNANLDSSNTELKLIDTDLDTISDWDELFIYATSPYLEDTDGDGLSDYEEVFTYKTSPTCAEGQVCSGVLTQGDSQNTLSQENATTTASSSLLESFNEYYGENLSEDKLPTELTTGTIDPAYVRELLLNNGFAKEELDKISDEELMAVYKETLADF